MNERIKDLAIKAGYEEDMFGIGYWDTIECKKFADLILEECYKYLKDEAERLYALNHDDGDLLAEKCYDIMEGLKDHFEDPHPPTRDCDCTICQRSFDSTEVPDWKFYGKKL